MQALVIHAAREKALRALLASIGASLVFVVSPASALAAERVASPSGSASAACTTADPCDLSTAIQNANAGDDVLVESGDYGSASTPLTNSITANATSLTVHGPSGGPRPRIYLGTTPASLGGVDGLVFTSGVTLRDLEVDNLSTAPGAQAVYAGSGSTIDHVIASTAGISDLSTSPHQIGAALIVNLPASIFDTVAYATNAGAGLSKPGAEALRLQGQGATAVVRNVTVVAATGGANFAADIVGLSGATTVTLQNTIIDGANGLEVTQQAGTMTVNANHDVISNENTSNGATFNADSTVSATAPVFTDAANHDYHEAATSSSTIDMGTQVPASDPQTDIDGDLRAIGASPDIGADELPTTPSATISGTSGIGDNQATVVAPCRPEGESRLRGWSMEPRPRTEARRPRLRCPRARRSSRSASRWPVSLRGPSTTPAS